MVLALSVGLIGCADGDGEPTEILVGLARDLEGPLKFFDDTSGGPTYRAFNTMVAADGGIMMSGYGKKLPLTLKIRPYDPTVAGDLTTQTEALITLDKVHFLWGGPGTGTIYVQAPIADFYGITLMTLEGGATDMMSDPDKLPSWGSVFVNLSFSDFYQIQTLHEMLDREDLPDGDRAPKAYVLYINNPHGFEYRDITSAVFGSANIVGSESHTDPVPTYDEIEDIVQLAKDALNTTGNNDDYDVFCAFSYAPGLFDVVAAADALDFDPPAIIMGPGATGGAFPLAVGNYTEGIMGFAVATNNTDVSPEAVTMTFAEMYAKIGPEAIAFPPSATWDVWGHPCQWAGLEMWKKAVETVGDLELGYTAKVRSVLIGFNSTNPCTTVMGDCWYKVFGLDSGGVIDYHAMPGQIGQWFGDYVEIVGFDGIDTENWAEPWPVGSGEPLEPLSKYDVTEDFEFSMQGAWNWL